jgi:hypothetical protein
LGQVRTRQEQGADRQDREETGSGQVANLTQVVDLQIRTRLRDRLEGNF